MPAIPAVVKIAVGVGMMLWGAQGYF